MNRSGLITATAGIAFAVASGAVNYPPAFFTPLGNVAQAEDPPDYENYEDYEGGDYEAPPEPQQVIPTNFKHETLASASTEPVGARLVCLFDVSGSVDDKEYDVQLEAMASAIGSDDFRDAIFFKGGPESVALCVVDFGDISDLRIGWVDIRKGDEAKLKLLANEIRALKRRESGSTNHGSAMQMAIACLKGCPWDARKSIVDLITDGMHNSGTPPDDYVKELTKMGATINALVTLTSSENIEKYARERIVTPPGQKKPDGSPLDSGFVKVVATQTSADNPGAIVEYHKAMQMAFRRKLILEVAGITLEELEKLRASSWPPAHPLPFTPQSLIPL